MKPDGVKNVLLGFLLGVCVVLALGAARQGSDRAGRYTISSGSERTYFVMDTRTGQHWYMIAERTGSYRIPRGSKSESE